MNTTELHELLTDAEPAERERILRETVRAEVAAVLSRPTIEDDSNFLEEGLTSLTALELTRNLMSRTDLEVPLAAVIEYPTPARLGQYLFEVYTANNAA